MQDDNGSIVFPSPYGAIPRDSHATDPRGGRRRRGTGDICGFFPTVVEVSGMSGGRLSGFPAREHNPVILRDYFVYRHWKAKILILKESLSPLLR